MNDAFNQYMKLAFKGVIKSKEFSHYANLAKRSKYGNKKTVIGNIVFDSKKESERFLELTMLEKAGVIKNLERQKRFEIIPKTETERAAFYCADFVYEENGKLICEDVKSDATRRDKTYILKRKLFKYLYKNYEFREV